MGRRTIQIMSMSTCHILDGGHENRVHCQDGKNDRGPSNLCRIRSNKPPQIGSLMAAHTQTGRAVSPPGAMQRSNQDATPVGRMRQALAQKAALLVVTLALACAVVVVSIDRWNVGVPAMTMWRSPGTKSNDGGWLRSSASPSLAALAPPQPPATDSDGNPACRFDYPGPLRPESYDCYSEFFPLLLPFSYPEMVTLPGRSFSLSGVTSANASVPRVPIIVLFKDRVSVLMETLRSFYRYLGTPYEIVIFNDNSTYPDAVRFLDRLRASGVQVHDNARRWQSFDELFEVVADFVDVYTKASRSPYYVLTDPDCALDSAPWNLLQVYQHALESLQLTAVGTALRWDDFPETMTLGYEANVAKLPPKALLYNDRNYYYIDAPVDTTFAMYRAGPRLRRLKGQHVRMLPPLGARHLDFYLSKDRLPNDYKYYQRMARAGGVNHMGHLDVR